MGGEERLRKHHDAGKLDARARIDHLLDPGSFLEIGTLVGGTDAPADAVVIGSGSVDGRPVMVAAEDFTVLAGTISSAANAKRYRVAEIAETDRIPLVMMLEGAGFRADGKAHPRAPTDLLAQASCSGKVPLVTAILGASAGHGALVAPISDFTVMSSHASVFTAGPPVVLESLGERISKEDLGGPDIAVASGLVHNVAPDDAAALDLVRAYLRYFPSSAWSYPAGCGDQWRGVPRRTGATGHHSPQRAARIRHARCPRRCLRRGLLFRSATTVRSIAHLRAWPSSAVTPWPWLPTNPMCWLARSMPTERTRPHISSPSPTRSTYPSSFWPTTPGSCRGANRSSKASCGVEPECTRPRPRPGSRSWRSPCERPTASDRWSWGSSPSTASRRTFTFPGATMGAMGAAAMSRARGSDVDEAAQLRQLEVEASYRSARSFGQDELISPVEVRDRLLGSLERALYRRQAAPEPAARVAIMP